MFHLAAYNAALGVGTDIDIPALTDDVLSQQNTHFVLNRPMNLKGALVMSPLLDRAKISSATMRQLAAPYVRPVQQGAAGVSNPNLCLWDNNPYLLPPFEELQVMATSTIGASTERFVAGLFLEDTPQPIPTGGWTPLRFTSTTVPTANVWTTLALTWADTIPSGVFAMVLSEHFSATAQLHRWIFSNQMSRPGFPSFVNAFSRHPYAIAKGQFGQMGIFRSNDLPRLQVLCTAGDTTHTGYASVIKIGNL